MVKRTVYLEVRLDITDNDTNDITDDELDEIISNMDYKFESVGNNIKTEIVGYSDNFSGC